MTIILDLDYTLLDTGRFKETLASVFTDCGIDEERFLESYRRTAEHDPAAYDYELERHIGLLAEELTCPADQLREAVIKVIYRTGDFLYPGAKEFVAKLRELGFRTVLLSLGNAGWQKQKVDNSGLVELLNEIVLVRCNKADALSRLSGITQPTFVVNDNCNEVRAMIQAEPTFHYIVKRGPKGVTEELEAPVLDTFEEILEEIQQQML